MQPKQLLFLLVVAVVLSLKATECVGDDVRIPGPFKVDLDAAPETRWNAAITGLLASKFGGSTAAVFEPYITYMRNFFTLVHQCDATCMNSLSGVFKSFASADDLAELVGIQSAFAAVLPATLTPTLTELAAWQFIYEMDHVTPPANLAPEKVFGCTAVAACDASGNTGLGRNYDTTSTQEFRNITVAIEFVRGGKVVARSAQFLGILGVHTAVSSSSFAVAINGHKQGESLDSLLNCLQSNTTMHPLLLQTRSLLLAVNSFKASVSMFEKGTFCVPAYFAFAGAGVGEGVIITKKKENSGSFKPLWVDCQSKTGGWKAVVSNYDWWIQQPLYDDRAHFTSNALDSIGQAHDLETTLKSMWQVLGMKGPGLNNTVGPLTPITLFTSLLNPNTTTLDTFLRI